MPCLPSLQKIDPLAKEVTLRALQSTAAPIDCGVWQDLVTTGRLDEYTPEDIVGVCRRLDPIKNDRLAGQLMGHIAVLATRFLARRINPNRPNGGKDTLDNVRSGGIR